MPVLSNRAELTPASPIRKLAPLAQDAKHRGVKVFHLNIGQPDIESPALFFEGVKHFTEKVVAYEGSNGRESLCLAWSKYMNATLGLATRPEQFLITTGGSEALMFSFFVCCGPAEEILTFDPTYANYLGFAAMAGVNLVAVPANISDNFALPPQDVIERNLSPRTRAILLCNPNNPTGTIYTRQEMQRLLDLCEEHNLFLIVDETYRELVYDGQSPLSILHMEPDNPRVIMVDSLSKRFSLTGARIGCLYSTNHEVLHAAQCMAQARLSVATIEQYATAYMLERIPTDFVAKMVAEYQTRRDVLFNALRAIPGVTVHKPQGAFYIVASLPVRDAEAFASFMLTDFQLKGRTTFVAPAAGFYLGGKGGRNEVRVAYVLGSAAIREAIQVLGAGLEAYKKIER